MSDYRAIARELDEIASRLTELDELLSPLHSQFVNWVYREFPRDPSASCYDTYWPSRVYSLEGDSLSPESPTTAQGFRFIGTDFDGSWDEGVLPFLWLEDREACRQHITQEAARLAEANNAAAVHREARDRDARIAAARQLLAEVDGQ